MNNKIKMIMLLAIIRNGYYRGPIAINYVGPRPDFTAETIDVERSSIQDSEWQEYTGSSMYEGDWYTCRGIEVSVALNGEDEIHWFRVEGGFGDLLNAMLEMTDVTAE